MEPGGDWVTETLVKTLTLQDHCSTWDLFLFSFSSSCIIYCPKS